MLHIAVLYDEHADEQTCLDLLRDDDASLDVRLNLQSVLQPFKIVGRIGAPRRIAHQLDHAALLHVLGARHLHGWKN